METATQNVYFKFLQEKEASALIAQGMREKNPKLRFFGTYSSYVHQAVDYIIEKYYTGGEIAITYMIDACTKVAEVYDAFSFFHHLRVTNSKYYERTGTVFGTITEEIYPDMNPNFKKDIIAVGELTEDYEDGDSDPYPTAGGYRQWKALKGTRVVYIMNTNLSVHACFLSNCMVDHYNNNFAGVSTGGGTTNYKIGERTALRGLTLGREFLDKGWKKSKLSADVKIIDADKALQLCAENHPDFIGLIR
jgi:hypothetical protein